MKHPPYHLRQNKSVDRLLLVDLIGRLGKKFNLADYTYYGFGGPYLEEFRLIYELCPDIQMVSFEDDPETYKRQKFHLPCGNLTLEDTPFKSFIANYESRDNNSVFWLDYTKLSFGNFEDFMTLLRKVARNSMLKISLRCEPRDYDTESKTKEDFRMEFDALLPDPSTTPPLIKKKFARLLQDMLQFSSEKTLSSSLEIAFLPLSSFYYADGICMFTLTGIVCLRDELEEIKSLFQGWEFANLNWSDPCCIDLPVLSTKERLHLQAHLPCNASKANYLLKKLGYEIDDTCKKSINKIEHYLRYHRYNPFFMKAIP